MSKILTSRLTRAAVVEEAEATSLQKLDGVLSELNALHYYRPNPDAPGTAVHMFALSNGVKLVVTVDKDDDWQVYAPVSLSSDVDDNLTALRALGQSTMKHPASITAKLERISYDYRNDMEVAIANVDEVIWKSLTELVEEFGHEAVEAAVEASEDSDLRIDYEPYSQLDEALVYVLDQLPEEAFQDS